MLDSNKKRKIDTLRDLLVGVVPNPVDQVKQISIALVYKFMNDQDQDNIALGGEAIYFKNNDNVISVSNNNGNNANAINQDYSKYSWHNLMDSHLTTIARSNLYAEMLSALELNQNIPVVFQHIFKGAFLSYRNPDTLTLFLNKIGEFDYNHDSEQLGDAFEYLLSILGSQGQAGQFRTPRHIIDFIVQIMKPTKLDKILDPACGTAGFLISSFQYIENNEQLEISERSTVFDNIYGYDITPDMVKFALVNLYLHGDKNPHIYEYDTLSSVDRWQEKFTCILANPPFMTPKGGIKPHAKFRISANKSEVLFVDYILEHLHLNGRAGIIVPEGVIFQTAKAYKELRKLLVDGDNNQGNLVAVISLPSGVFKPYSGVKTSILIVDKLNAKTNDKILLVKINNDGFDLGDKRNPINKNDLPMALTVIEHYLSAGATGGGYAPAQAHSHAHVSVEQFEKDNVLLVDKIKLAENDYNLSFDRYKISDTVQTSSYPMVKLGEVCEFINGFAFKPTDWESTGIPIVRIQNLTGTSKIYNYTNKQDVPQKYVINKFDLLISWSASIGFYMWHMDKAYLNQHIFKVICSDCINKQYLYYLKDFIVCKIHEMTHGNTMQHITKSNFENIEIPLPPLDIQQQIVNEIEQYQKIIDGARQIIDNYKPKIEIDPSWEKVQLEDVCKFVRGPFGGSLKKEIFVQNGYAVYEQSHASTNNFDEFRYFVTQDKYDEMKRFQVEPGDLIMSCSGTIGKTAIIPCNTQQGIINQALLKLTVNYNLNVYFLKLWIESDDFQQIILDNTIGAAIQNVASVSVLSKLLISLPPLEIQQQIVAQLESEQHLVDNNKLLIEIMENKIKATISKVWNLE